MARTWSKLWILLWKNFTLQRRHRVQTLVQILVPVLFSLLLVGIRSMVKTVRSTETTLYEPFSPGNCTGTAVDSVANSSMAAGVRVAYSPTGPAVDAIMTRAVKYFHQGGVAYQFPNEDDLLANLIRPNAMNNTLAAVIFDSSLAGMTELPQDIQFKLRFPGESRLGGSASTSSSWNTDRLFPANQQSAPRLKDDADGGNVPGYHTEGFLALQHFVSISIIEQVSGNTSLPAVRLKRLPFPPYVSDPLVTALQNVLPIVVVLGFLYTCTSIVRVITYEKESQMKESMKIMGLPNWMLWTTWFINNFLLLLVSVVLMVVVMKSQWFSSSGSSLFTKSDGVIIFIYLLLYAVTTICFCFMISSFFSKARPAASLAGMCWFVTYIPYMFLQLSNQSLALGTKLAVSLLSNSAVSFGLQLILTFEATGEGLQWSSIWKPATQDDNLVFGHIVILLIVDALLYLLIALYIEAVFPGIYGVPKPWYFFVQKSFWCGGGGTDSVKENKNHLSIAVNSSDSVEPEPALPVGIEIKQLSKEYDGKLVVDGLSLNMYEGQITVLLGHNGAGKTTTMAMLTGMTTPTRGTAVVGGRDVRTEMDRVRDSLGVCPQHNVLFDELTVAEHMHFFGKLKGMETHEIKAEIHKYLTVLELLPKENSRAQTLSGGMKRKLSAAIALCGHSKVVIIDEPTSGLDPAARRTLWSLLKLERPGRTILLTTHFMDEADFLGDRIAIMAAGQLRCSGSPFFLKKKYGVGYQLVVVKRPECSTDEVTRLLRRHIPGVEVSQDVASELSYLLEEESSAHFEPMLRELEDSQETLCIDSFGVSLTSMEEVFIKVGREQEAQDESTTLPLDQKLQRVEDHDNSSHANSTYNLSDSTVAETLTGCKLVLNQILAMLFKHVLHTLRSWATYLLHVILPVLYLVIALVMNNRSVATSTLPALELSLKSYSSPVTPVEAVSSDGSAVGLYEQFKNVNPPGLVDLGNYNESVMSSYALQQAERNLASYTQNFIVGSTFAMASAASTPEATGWFSNQPFHALPVALNLVHNSILRSTAAGTGRSIIVVNHPLPYTASTQVNLQTTTNSGFQVAFNFVMGLSFISAFYVMFYIKERVTKAKLLQFVSGVNVLTFWGTAFVWDLFKFLVFSLVMVLTLLCSQKEGYAEPDQLGRIFLVLLLFSCAMLPMMYLASFLFSVDTGGYTKVMMFNIITGAAGMMLTMFAGSNIPDEVLGIVLILFPLYSMGSCINNLYNNAMMLKACAPFKAYCSEEMPNQCCMEARLCPNGACAQMVENYFDWKTPGIGRNVGFFFFSAIVFAGLLLLIEFNIFGSIMYRMKKVSSKKTNEVSEDCEPDDSDVVAENLKLHSTDLSLLKSSYDMLLIDLTKYYGRFLAVNKLCVGVKKGECFGLLGVNGAGKTSTFKMLTGDETISTGEAYISGYSLKTELKKVHQQIGYCPQFDALIETLTGRENLWLFCMLRGFPKQDIPYVIHKLADQLLFTKHLDKKVKQYSGGNKRKLSTAVALIGDPRVVYLDEPTSGMDVVAKRHLWNVISHIRDSGKCIVLTSHSMEECEALCTRIAIMVNGQFKCLGPTQHLKNKFAEGYTLKIKVTDTAEDTQPIKRFVGDSFEGAKLREEQDHLLTFYIPPISNLRWSRMFGVMEQAKATLHISDYSLGQTSLEQVFLLFARQQVSDL